MTNSPPRPLAAVILAGGQGKRLRFAGPKVLAPICGVTSLDHVLEAAAALRPDRTVVLACHQREKVEALLERRSGLEVVDQGEPLGTGHAVQKALEGIPDFRGDVLVLFGDGPLVRAETLQTLVDAHRQDRPACTLSTAWMQDPTGYGRILRKPDQTLDRVVEQRDASDTQRAVQEVHCGLAVFDSDALRQALGRIGQDNAQGEYYLTDAYQLLQEDGGSVRLVALGETDEGFGFNTPDELLDIRRRMKHRILADHQARGVSIEDPDTVFIDRNVSIGEGTVILPFTVIRGPVTIGKNCEIGPFTHLRSGASLCDGAAVGNFVEMKNSTLGPRSKAKHLTYLGDTTIGAGTNIGAGTITANYDGSKKHPTSIGDGAFIGSGAILVAPSEVGDGATVGAGAVVTSGRPVAPESVVVGIPARPLQGGGDQSSKPEGEPS